MAAPNLNRSLPSPPRVSRPPWSPPPPAPETLSNATAAGGGVAAAGGRGRPAPPRVASSSPVPVARAGTTIGLPAKRPLPPVNAGVRSATVSASAPTPSPISRSLPTPPPQSGSRPPGVPRSAPPSPAPVTASDSRVPPKPVMAGRAPSPTAAHPSSSSSSSPSSATFSSSSSTPSTSATASLPAFSASLQRPKPAESSGAASQPPNVLVPVPQRPAAFPAPSNGGNPSVSNGISRPPAKPAPLPPTVGAPTPPVAAATTTAAASSSAAPPPAAMPPPQPQPKFPATAGTRPGSWRASSSASMSTYAASPSAANANQLSDHLKKSTSFYHTSPPARPSMPSIAGARSSLSSSSSSIPSLKSMTSPTISARNSIITPTPEPEDAQAKKDRLRAEAVKELVFTEQDYINDLELVNEIFLKTLAARNILEKQELAALFSNMEMLVGVNQEILKGLKDDPQGDHIGQTFLGVMHYFKMYTVYCANQPHSDNALQKCKSKNSAFAAFLDECMADPRCRGLTLQSYLIKPIQRLCKYPLLLKTICHNTGEGHADHGNLREALAQMEKIVEYVNEGKRHAENSHKIMEIQSNIDGGESLGLVQPTRRLVVEGTFGVRLPRSKEFKDRYCVLFNDLFLCVKTRKKGTGYYDPVLLSLQSAKFIEIADTEEVINSFELQAEGEGEMKSVIFLFPSAEVKKDWAKEIKTIIRFYQKQRLLSSRKN